MQNFITKFIRFGKVVKFNNSCHVVFFITLMLKLK